jgi:hypothetical protein
VDVKLGGSHSWKNIKTVGVQEGGAEVDISDKEE